MPSLINADNGVVSGSVGLKYSTDNSGVLALQTNGTTAVTVDTSQNVGIGTTTPGSGIRLDVQGGEIRAGRIDTGSEGGQVSFSRASDNTTAWYLDVYGNTSTPSLRFVDVSAGAVRATIDGSGRVTMPYQPAFDAYGTVGNLLVTTEIPIPLNSTTFNIGNHYNTSNYRFTAPVAGMYFFRAQTYKQASGNASRLRLYKNAGDARVYQYISASDTYTHSITGIISLAVGDYVTCNFNSDGAGTNIYLADNHTNFSGYLLG